MKIHEFQAKTLLKRFGVAVPEGRDCSSVEQAMQTYDVLGGGVAVVKAQIHAGGRGKGGGVKVCKSADEVRAAASRILGMQLVTHQTGPQGQLVRRIWVEEGSAIEMEFYLGIAIDRESQLPVMMASSEGGMEIEAVAGSHPEKILKAAFEPKKGLAPVDAERLARGIGMTSAQLPKAMAFMTALARAFVELDCSIAEINPLVTTKQGDVLALDAKINFDDNALFRHEELLALRDLSEEQPLEIQAADAGLNYIKLDGTIGCMVNGAGLAMSTMDVIKLYGGEPANFLDVGGGATKEQVTAAFKILLADPKTQAVLINIFGGIMKCDVIAAGVVAAAREVKLDRPLVVRLEGTNVELGRKVLAESGLPIIGAKDLDDAAQKAVAAVKQLALSAKKG